MQGHFANRDKTGTARLSGRKVLILGWLACLGEQGFPFDPRTEKTGRKRRNREHLQAMKSRGKPAIFFRKFTEDGPIELLAALHP